MAQLSPPGDPWPWPRLGPYESWEDYLARAPHEFRPPSYFRVTLNIEKQHLSIVVGNNGDKKDEINIFRTRFYRVVFVPRTTLGVADLRTPAKVQEAWKGGQEICVLDAGTAGNNRTFIETGVLGISGWFFASSINQKGGESQPTAPFPNPMDPDLLEYAIPDDPVLISSYITLEPRTDTVNAFYSRLDVVLRPPASPSFSGVQLWITGYWGSGLLAGPYLEPPAPLNDIEGRIYLTRGLTAGTVYFVSVSQGHTHRTDITSAPSWSFLRL